MVYGTILQTKLANALFADVEAKGVPDVVEGALHKFKQRQGGLWVGGEATLTDTHVLFGANGLNESMHKGETSFAIPLGDITDVAVEFGFLTRIIAISTRGGATHRIRCFGARDFAERIRRQAKLA